MIQPNTPEWLEWRKNYIGGSDAPAIMEVSPWKTPHSLWLEKLQISQPSPLNNAMQRGTTLEPKARDEFDKMMGLLTEPVVKIHPSINYMAATLDGMDIEGKTFVEIKCPRQEDHKCALRGKIPEKYFPQLQHQLEVCQLEMAYYFSFDGEKGVIVKVFRDEKYIKELLKKEEEFWECVQSLKEPKLSEKDFVYRNDANWKHKTEKWLSLQYQIKNLTEEAELLKNQLIMEANNQNTKGAGIRVTKTIRKGNVNYKSIPELENVDLEKYRGKPVEYWNIRT